MLDEAAEAAIDEALELVRQAKDHIFDIYALCSGNEEIVGANLVMAKNNLDEVERYLVEELFGGSTDV